MKQNLQYFLEKNIGIAQVLIYSIDSFLTNVTLLQKTGAKYSLMYIAFLIFDFQLCNLASHIHGYSS